MNLLWDYASSNYSWKSMVPGYFSLKWNISMQLYIVPTVWRHGYAHIHVPHIWMVTYALVLVRAVITVISEVPLETTWLLERPSPFYRVHLSGHALFLVMFIASFHPHLVQLVRLALNLQETWKMISYISQFYVMHSLNALLTDQRN